MADFSIESAVERIHDSRSRSYMKEVISSYNAENFRSATVMLWSVVVCDILFKLDELTNSYGDATASGIIKEIEGLQKANPRSPEWEWKLVELVLNRTKLLEPADFAHLDALQNDRHLAAHPVLTASFELHSPTKENVRSHIRNALEGLLTKPPIMTKKVFHAFTEDLEAVQSVMIDDMYLTKYLTAKYFKNLHPAIEDSIFRSLWRLVLRSEDPQCTSNRDINFRALRLLYLRRRQYLKNLISADATYYSEISSRKDVLWLTFRFLSEFPEIRPNLTDAANAPIKAITDTDFDFERIFIVGFREPTDFDFAAVAWFYANDMTTHLNGVIGKIDGDHQIGSAAYHALYAAAKENGQDKLAREIAITSYSLPSCWSYDRADLVFGSLLRPYIKEYDTDDLTKLLVAIEGNGLWAEAGKRGPSVP